MVALTDRASVKGHTEATEPIQADDLDIDKAIADVEAPDTFTSQNGIVFKLMKVPKFLFVEVGRKIKEPRPPTFKREDGRTDSNPLDPDYKAAHDEWGMEQGLLTMKLFTVVGTKITYLPPGMEPPESHVWSDELLEQFGLPTSESGKARYYEWCKYYALFEEDFDNLWQKAGRYSGLIKEAEVAAAVADFPRDPERGTDLELPLAKASPD